MELTLVQFLVLAFTGALWWIARRDLKAGAPQASGPAPAELEQLCATMEALVLDLERRADAACQRLLEAERQFQQMTPPARAAAPGAAPPELRTPVAAPPELAPPDEIADARYSPVYELLSAGVTDRSEIVRRTGLGQGEVDLILSLRARRAL